MGSGGREHALAWKFLQSTRLGNIYVAPGNGGTGGLNVPIFSGEIQKLKDFAKENECFTVVGPEAPLAAGIVDEFNQASLPIFGPTREQAKLESSKSFAKQFMEYHDIPTAEFEIFEDSKIAKDYVERKGGNVVVKADGLASGKGVFVCSSPKEAQSAIEQILEKKVFGKSGEKIVIEDKLNGREASYMFLCDGRKAIDFSSAVDHKRALDGDKGSNTGGMGAFSPAPKLDERHHEIIKEKVANPVVKFSGFKGFLFVGLMIDEKGNPSVLEFNARLGDPETQAILPRLRSDILDTLLNLEQGTPLPNLEWDQTYSCTVVMCSEGYPEHPKIGDEIFGIESASTLDDVIVFHSGTVKKDNSYYTNGGRVLSVTGIGDSPKLAAKNAYSAVSLITWRGERHRSDIASSPG